MRNEQAGALVAAIGDHGNSPAGHINAGLGEGPAVVAAAGQRIADGHDQAAVGVDDDLQVRRLAAVLARGGDAAVPGGNECAVDDVHGVLALAAPAARRRT
ncbi:hypothetical protein GCM10010431_85460 [Streptomyces kunmingensis]